MSDLTQYDYDLPRELIAQHPLSNRSDARLLVVDRARQELTHRYVRDLGDILKPGDCLVLNDTRVLPARLLGNRTETGGRWEGLFLSADDQRHWHLLCKTRGKLRGGDTITLIDRLGRHDFRLKLLTKLDDGSWIAAPESDEELLSLLDRVGRVPLPRYIRGGEMDESDRTRYQTVFAQRAGSVAAPTAGLHFSKDLLRRLERDRIKFSYLTLHVGLGTFQPIATENIESHPMHREWGQIETTAVDTILTARGAGHRVVAVGSTSVRLLETASAGGELQAYSGETDLFIRPGYPFRIVDALMTNFHLPKTTLLVLVRTFGGDELIRSAYDEAIRERYRFYSYGDAMLIL